MTNGGDMFGDAGCHDSGCWGSRSRYLADADCLPFGCCQDGDGCGDCVAVGEYDCGDGDDLNGDGCYCYYAVDAKIQTAVACLWSW